MQCSIYRLRDVQRLTGLSRSQIYALASRGSFPRPIKLSERASGWLSSEVEQWIADRIQHSRENNNGR